MKNASSITLLLALALSLCGCAPFVHMNVEIRDGNGNRADSAEVTNRDAGPSRTLRVANGYTIVMTAVAEFNDGLQGLWIEGSGHCSTSNTIQSIGFVIPPSGNAISGNQAPAQFTFTDTYQVSGCDSSEFGLSLRAAARSVPTTGIFGGGPATTWTQAAQISK